MSDLIEKHAAWFLIALISLTALFLSQTRTADRFPYPRFAITLSSPQTNLHDTAGTVLGLRRFAADLAWIQTLQYYGTPEEGQTEFEFHNGLGKYPLFFSLCQRVVSIDPYFTYVYYYGGAVLGWNLNRLEEAERLIKQGISYNPQEWRLPQYLAGLAYQKNHDIGNLTRFLESIVADPQCPLMMKALLANLYKKQHRYDDAVRLWEDVYVSGDAHDQARAQHEIIEIKQAHRKPLP